MDINAIIAGLDGLSLFLGSAVGLLVGVALVFVSRNSMRRSFDEALAEQKSSFDETLIDSKSAYESATAHMKSAFESLSNQALIRNQQEFLELAKGKLEDQEKQHSNTLEGKKELIEQQLQSMSKSMTETLNTVPVNLKENQKNVSDALDKSTKDLKESNQNYLTQLSEKTDAQTEAHQKELDTKKELIDQRLTDMDVKLGKVERLVQELQTDRKTQYGALGQQLQSLTSTTNALQKALADNQARGQWGERIAEQILDYLGLREGISYTQQAITPSGEKPDFTFLLPNHLSLNMDCKFPIDNYLKYVEAENDGDRAEYRSSFLRNVEKHVTDVTKRDYINPQTVDCVLIFIPNEQIYRFIHEMGSSVIDAALRNKVILCSPLTLYIVLAVIRQASQNFNVEQRSREIFALVNEIRDEWKKYTDQMSKLERSFKSINDNFHRLNFTRSRALDRRFDKIEIMLDSNEVESGDGRETLLLGSDSR